MRIRASDYLLIRFCQHSQSLLRRVAEWETRLLGAELANIRIDRPVFITGLARSGTTLLLELLAAVEGVATHRYRDFPFLMIPYLWNRYLGRFPGDQPPIERAHRDRIYISRESPEAMEEPLWRTFFPHIHTAGALHRMTRASADADFERFYKAHIRKLLLIRRGRRYLAKANYHVPRIEYLAHLFPDARFVVPVRHPLTHIESLVRQHQLFSSYAKDARVPRYLEAAGHFEFGPQRMPIRLDAERSAGILEAWSRGEEHLGYAIQWAEVYGFVNTLREANSALAERILIVRYEDLCSAPEAIIARLMHEIEWPEREVRSVLDQLDRVAISPHIPAWDDAARQGIWAEAGDVAREYGYSRDS